MAVEFIEKKPFRIALPTADVGGVFVLVPIAREAVSQERISHRVGDSVSADFRVSNSNEIEATLEIQGIFGPLYQRTTLLRERINQFFGDRVIGETDFPGSGVQVRWREERQN